MQPSLFLIHHKVRRMSVSLPSAGNVTFYKLALLTLCLCVFRTLREQWIRAKYERKEFSEPGKNFIYEEGECVCTNTHAYMHTQTHIYANA